MGSPVVPKYHPYNWNVFAYPAFATAVAHCMTTRHFVVTSVANFANPNDPEAVAQAAVTSDWGSYYQTDPKEDPHEP